MRNAEMAAHAVRGLGELGTWVVWRPRTSHPDQFMPGHGVMVHGELGWPRLEVVTLAGICLAGTAAFKHAWLSVRSGEAQRAVAVASELASLVLRGRNFDAESEYKVQALEGGPRSPLKKISCAGCCPMARARCCWRISRADR